MPRALLIVDTCTRPIPSSVFGYLSSNLIILADFLVCAVCTWCARHPGLFGGKARNAPLLRRRVTRRPRNRSCRPHSAPPLAPGPSPPWTLLGWVANGPVPSGARRGPVLAARARLVRSCCFLCPASVSAPVRPKNAPLPLSSPPLPPWPFCTARPSAFVLHSVSCCGND